MKRKNNFYIRSVWDSEKGDYCFSVVDVIAALTNSNRARKYWNDLKINLIKEGSELSEKIGQLKLKSSKDGNFSVTDWLRNRNTIEFLGIWEEMHNQNF